MEYLRFDISVIDAVFMHVIYRFEDLIHVEFHSLFRQVMSPALYCLVHVHIHELKD